MVLNGDNIDDKEIMNIDQLNFINLNLQDKEDLSSFFNSVNKNKEENQVEVKEEKGPNLGSIGEMVAHLGREDTIKEIKD